MGEQIPLFEGFRPLANEVKLTGTVGQDESEVFRIGQKAYFLVRGECVGINHERRGKDATLVRSHKFDIIGLSRVDSEKIVSEALVTEAYNYLETLKDSDEPEPEGE
jgi:hypothetical protein